MRAAFAFAENLRIEALDAELATLATGAERAERALVRTIDPELEETPALWNEVWSSLRYDAELRPLVQERYREVGLLRAMGAKPNQVMTIILTEAAIITGLGGIAGLGFGAAMLLLFARSLGFYFGLLGVPFSWPPLAVLQISAILAISFSAILGLVGAFLPAWRARRMAPYALIQAEGR
jgi:hypothetical protein